MLQRFVLRILFLSTVELFIKDTAIKSVELKKKKNFYGTLGGNKF